MITNLKTQKPILAILLPPSTEKQLLGWKGYITRNLWR